MSLVFSNILPIANDTEKHRNTYFYMNIEVFKIISIFHTRISTNHQTLCVKFHDRIIPLCLKYVKYFQSAFQYELVFSVDIIMSFSMCGLTSYDWFLFPQQLLFENWLSSSSLPGFHNHLSTHNSTFSSSKNNASLFHSSMKIIYSKIREILHPYFE